MSARRRRVLLVGAAAVMSLLVGLAVGLASRPAATASAAHLAAGSTVELRILERRSAASDRPWRAVGPRFVPSSFRLLGRPPISRLYLARDVEGQVCLLLLNVTGRYAATCRTEADAARVGLEVRLVDLPDQGGRVGIEGQLHTDGHVAWARV